MKCTAGLAQGKWCLFLPFSDPHSKGFERSRLSEETALCPAEPCLPASLPFRVTTLKLQQLRLIGFNLIVLSMPLVQGSERPLGNLQVFNKPNKELITINKSVLIGLREA